MVEFTAVPLPTHFEPKTKAEWLQTEWSGDKKREIITDRRGAD